MDMVAEAKKRVEEDWYFHRLPILGIQSDTIRYTNEDGVKGLLLAEVVGDTPAARFIANTPAFIVAQDERIQRLEKIANLADELALAVWGFGALPQSVLDKAEVLADALNLMENA